MANNGEEIGEILITPLSRLLGEVGRSVAETQRALDLNSIKTQIEIDEEKADPGLQACPQRFSSQCLL
ncbi:hypothetical protein MmTuc01_2174 [Methanosarcina mazei Tuc01]|uniref:Uncharacterized protein n=1 Tax=Methanosarcina mazei Tuc01 TaxID=1236903 RepID=M1PAI1_METMZ|nr:hypothetical protein [Methanosarcina mazei]AGF97502.1 hypothetical protein MmTuc01_2174 [Methanosarcina mazei Tuc01]